MGVSQRFLAYGTLAKEARDEGLGPEGDGGRGDLFTLRLVGVRLGARNRELPELSPLQIKSW